MKRIGIDTGGTFTDLVVFDEETGHLAVTKRPSTPATPAEAIFDAVAHSSLDPATVGYAVLGTTIGTNAVLERKGARVFYVTTAGFEDVPFIQRINRKYLYDLQWQKPDPLSARRDCLGVIERIDKSGRVVIPLTDDALESLGDAIAERLRGEDSPCAVAVNLLFSYANPVHEERIGAFLSARFPELPVSLSHRISPTWREYERGTTTSADAFMKPMVTRFVAGVNDGFRKRGLSNDLFFMKSNGGQVVAASAAAKPVDLMLSGLAGGIIAGRHIGQLAGAESVITFDMGGTSTDVGVVTDGGISYTTEYELEFGMPVAAPCIDLKTIGAGGSSIATIDRGGRLKVGPESAAADPGPACYGKGGAHPTVTDANVVLGRLNPAYFLGGYIRLDAELAHRAVGALAGQLGMDVVETAQAIVQLANENMANAIRMVTVERGVDHRDYALVAFGGAGPMHAVALASALEMKRIVVPPHPGLTSAFGALLADLRVDKRWTHAVRSDAVEASTLDARFDELTRQALEELRREGFAGGALVERSISMRYAGQNYEQDVEVPAGAITPERIQEVFASFHAQHARFYGYSMPADVIEMVHYNVTAIGVTPSPQLPTVGAGPAPEPLAHRSIHFKDAGWLVCPIYRREALPRGTKLDGPAVIEEEDSTVVVEPAWRTSIDARGLLIIDAAGEGSRELKVQPSPSTPDTLLPTAMDQVTLTIVDNHLINICQEMAIAMKHTALSPIFNEGLDFVCVLFNRRGELIAQAEMNPALIAPGLFSTAWAIEEFGTDSFQPGDVLITNDPYRGCAHMPEHTVLKPIFYRGELFGFAANVAHVAEIGGMAVGSFAANATDVFQEGLRLPLTKLMNRGEYVKDVWRIIMANHRTPDNTWGDFHAMLGSLDIGERRVLALLDKFGPDFLDRATDELIVYADRWMRSEIAKIPDGQYSFADQMDDDGFTREPVPICVNVTVQGDRAIVDYTGSAQQARGPVNATYVVTAASAYNAIFQLTSPDVPRNSGSYRAITIIAPPGSVVNVAYPGPCVGGQTETHPRLLDMVQGGALSQALPRKVAAAGGGTSCNFLFGGVHPETGRYFAHYHFEGIGWGGRFTSDGNNVQCVPHGNCQNTPIEILETRFPLRHNHYGLRPDSGGPGRTRGGLGPHRVFEITAPEMRVNALFDRTESRPWGLFGGLPADRASILVKPRGTERFMTFCEAFSTASPSKFTNVVLHAGDQVMIDSPGGGGYGPPEERGPELVRRDVEEGFVSPEAARQFYRVALIQRDGRWLVDTEATTALRRQGE